MTGADEGVKDILVADATLGVLIGGTGTNARCKVGNRPQGQVLPAVTVNVNSADPQNVKGNTAPSDFVEVYAYTYAASELDARVVANAVRAAIDGKKDIVTSNGIKIGLIWFADEQYFDDMIADNIIHHYEQRFFVKLKNI